MLLEFKAENYRSFKDEFNFSMIPYPKKNDLNYSILSQKICKKTYKGLCSSVIYGPNASGKSNIVGAMETFKKIILRGHVKDYTEKFKSNNIAAFDLSLIPNNKLNKKKPVKFSIKFTTECMVFEYKLTADLGAFFDENYKRKILEESLYVNEDLIFERGKNIIFSENKILKKYASQTLIDNFSAGAIIAATSLKDDELFLMNGFRTIFAPKLVEIITDWLDKNLIVIYRSDSFSSTLDPLNKQKGILKLPINLGEFVSTVDSDLKNIYYIKKDENSEAKLFSVFKKQKESFAVLSEAIESYGTIRLINMLMPLLHTLKNGSTLVMDEFDSSLHPMVVMSIINLFHNPDINKNNAQLIFNTHNPIFLNPNLFRRDEIKFVEKEDDLHSVLYSLADFPTSGKGSVRNSTNYMKNYFVSRYGAIKDIDFTDFFEKTLNTPGFGLEKSKDSTNQKKKRGGGLRAAPIFCIC